MSKCGTTWLKALIFAISNRDKYEESPLLTASPRILVRFLDFAMYLEEQSTNIDQFPCPRIFALHSHYEALPVSLRDSSCRIVYICRNLLDQVVSYFHFRQKIPPENGEPLGSIEEGFDNICQGIQSFGPFWNSVLGYWKASLERPDKVLFLKYEDLKEDIISNMKKLAEFLGFLFSAEEEEKWVIEEISRLCSFESLKSSKTNENRTLHNGNPPHSAFFRKVQVGDWINYISPSMSERYKKIIEEKLVASGLTFKMSL